MTARFATPEGWDKVELAEDLLVDPVIEAEFTPESGEEHPVQDDGPEAGVYRRLPFGVRLRAEFDFGDGRYQVARLEFVRDASRGDEDITSQFMRTIPVHHLMSLALWDLVASKLYHPTRATALHAKYGDEWPPEVDDGPTDAMLLWVSTIYRVNFACGLPPTKAVQSTLYIPRSTAGRWVELARKRGYLGETAPGRARAGAIPDDVQNVVKRLLVQGNSDADPLQWIEAFQRARPGMTVQEVIQELRRLRLQMDPFGDIPKVDQQES